MQSNAGDVSPTLFSLYSEEESAPACGRYEHTSSRELFRGLKLLSEIDVWAFPAI